MTPVLTPSSPPDTASGEAPVPRGSRASYGGDWLRARLRRFARPTAFDLTLLAVVLVAIVAVEAAFVGEPVPPGADSGHWIVTSFSYIGRAHPSDFRVQPGVDPPMVFLSIGSVVLLVGSPITTGFVFTGIILALYGLTTIHLARRFVRTRPAQLMFVGAAVLNGTTLQMVFWGGYPNFLALSMFNESMVFLLGFVSTRRPAAGIAFFGFAALTYLTHSLTFSVFAASAAGAFALLLLQEPGLVRLGLNRGAWIGAGLFAGLVGGYLAITGFLGVPHAGYLFTNPATYAVDPVGLLFRPFHFAPAFWPRGPAFYLDSGVLVVLVLALAAVSFGSTAVLVRRFGARVPRSLVVAVGWVCAALALPVLGYLVHIDTDYPRFAYFLPLPVALAAVLAVETLYLRSSAVRTLGPSAPVRRPSRGVSYGAWSGTGLTLVALFALVTVPTVQLSEATFTTPSYDANFLSAVRYFEGQPTNGSVLTESTEAERWIEALTIRNAYTASSTWLDFYSAEILNSELSYWALNGVDTVSDGGATLEFSGPNATAFDAAPEYVPYLEGVPFPALRLSLGSLSVSYRSANGTNVTSPESSWYDLSLTEASGAPTVWATASTSAFRWNLTASLDVRGDAQLMVTVVPAVGVSLTGVSLGLRSPVSARIASAPAFDGFSYSGGTSFSCAVTGQDGALPTPSTVDVAGSLSVPPDPARSFVAPPNNRSTLVLNFPSSGGTFRLAIGLTPSVRPSNPAVTVPTDFTTAGFLAADGIRFAMFQTSAPYAPTVSLLERELGFVPVYSNSEWQDLERGGP